MPVPPRLPLSGAGTKGESLPFNLMIKCEDYSTWRSPSAVLDLLIEQFVSGEVTVKHKNLAYRAFMQP